MEEIRDDMADGPDGTSRRDFIRKGAIVGGALVWAVPAVQSIGMRAASASTISPPDIFPCDTQITINVTASNTWSEGSGGVVPGNGTCDFSSGTCDDIGTQTQRDDLFNAVSTSGWSTVVTVDGHKCVSFDLDILEAHYNAYNVDNCVLDAVIVKAGSDQSSTEPCQNETPPTGRQFTICRLPEVNPQNGQLETKDISSVTICLCCHVTTTA